MRSRAARERFSSPTEGNSAPAKCATACKANRWTRFQAFCAARIHWVTVTIPRLVPRMYHACTSHVPGLYLPIPSQSPGSYLACTTHVPGLQPAWTSSHESRITHHSSLWAAFCIHHSSFILHFWVALRSHWSRIGVALVEPWGGFRVAMGCLSVGYQQALGWL